MANTVLPSLLAIFSVVGKTLPDVVTNLSQSSSFVLSVIDCHSDQSYVGEWRLLWSLQSANSW